MKTALAIVGGVLAFQASIGCLMLLVWAARGHVPDFLEVSFYGIASVIMTALITVGGVTAAIQLWRLKPSGRVVAAVVAAYGGAFTIYGALRAGRLGEAVVWGTVALNVAMLVIVLLPAAAEACRPRVPARTLVNAPAQGRAR